MNTFKAKTPRNKTLLYKVNEYRITGSQYTLAHGYGEAVAFVHQGCEKNSGFYFAFQLTFSFYNSDHADESYNKTDYKLAHENFLFNRGCKPFRRTVTGDKFFLCLN
jgi:hypothetical protein